LALTVGRQAFRLIHVTSLKHSAPFGAFVTRWLFGPAMCAILGMLIWALGYVVVRELRFDVPPVWLSFWRNTTALVVYVAIAYPRLKRNLPEIIRGWRPLAWGSLLLIVFGNVPMTISLTKTTLVNVSIISAVEPMMIIVFAVLLYHMRISVRQWIGVALSLVGMLLLIARADINVLLNVEFNGGDLWALTAVLCWSLYVAGLRTMPLSDRPFLQTAAVTFFGEVLMLPWFVWDSTTRPAFEVTWDAVLAALYLGVIASVIALWLWVRALTLLGPARGGPFAHLLPVFGILLGIAFLGETLFSYHIVGIALIALGIYLTSLVRAKAR
jgi:drug/metabolite transporter (DMT)-like permease